MMGNRLLVLAALVLAGCTSTLADVKPGLPIAGREEGFDRTTEGLSMTVLDRSPAEVWAASQRAALGLASGVIAAKVRLEVAESQPPTVLKLQARDLFGACCVYYVGIFITGQERVTTVEVNKRDNYVNVRSFCPCEADYLRAIERELKPR
jgi:hypothetical protein